MKVKSQSEVAQSCLTLHDPIDCSLQDSSVHGILQARVLEWGAIAFSELYARHWKEFTTKNEDGWVSTQIRKVLVFAHLASESAKGPGRRYLLKFHMFPQYKKAEVSLTKNWEFFHYCIGLVSLSLFNC